MDDPALDSKAVVEDEGHNSGVFEKVDFEAVGLYFKLLAAPNPSCSLAAAMTS